MWCGGLPLGPRRNSYKQETCWRSPLSCIPVLSFFFLFPFSILVYIIINLFLLKWFTCNLFLSFDNMEHLNFVEQTLFYMHEGFYARLLMSCVHGFFVYLYVACSFLYMDFLFICMLLVIFCNFFCFIHVLPRNIFS